MASPRTSQFNLGLSSAEAMAACGPAAAMAFAQTYGRNPTSSEAIQLARSVGWSSGGMRGPQSEQQLLNQLGVATKFTPGADWNAIANEANTGNPVIISTPGHYYYADGYNPANGSFHVGTSGTDLKSGSEWMTPNQMQGLMGQVQGTIYADHPLEGQSTQVQGTITPQQQASPFNTPFLNYFYGGGQQSGQMPSGGMNLATPMQNVPSNNQGIPAEFANKPYAQEAYNAAVNAGIDPNVFLRQINQESGFNPTAGSSKGAQGIAQIVPKYHPGVNTADPVASLNYAANLDKQLLGQYGGDYTKALVAYNGGQGAVDAWNSGSPYGESQQYINSIMSGQTPTQYTGGTQPNQQMGIQSQQQPKQPPKGVLGQLFGMGGLWANPTLTNSNAGPSILSQALQNSYTNTPPPTAQSNQANLFSSIFTRPG